MYTRSSFVLPLSVQGPFDAFWADACAAGRVLGKPDGWEPEHLDAGVLALLQTGSARISYAPRHKRAHYPFLVHLRIDEHLFAQRTKAEGVWDPRGREATIVAAFLSDKDIEALGFEVEGVVNPVSSFGAVSQFEALEAAFQA